MWKRKCIYPKGTSTWTIRWTRLCARDWRSEKGKVFRSWRGSCHPSGRLPKELNAFLGKEKNLNHGRIPYHDVCRVWSCFHRKMLSRECIIGARGHPKRDVFFLEWPRKSIWPIHRLFGAPPSRKLRGLDHLPTYAFHFLWDLITEILHFRLEKRPGPLSLVYNAPPSKWLRDLHRDLLRVQRLKTFKSDVFSLRSRQVCFDMFDSEGRTWVIWETVMSVLCFLLVPKYLLMDEIRLTTWDGI